MYQLLEACLILVLCTFLIWAAAFGLTVNGTHYELVCARGCRLVETPVEARRFNLARRVSAEHLVPR
jgi:hypothetical protein